MASVAPGSLSESAVLWGEQIGNNYEKVWDLDETKLEIVTKFANEMVEEQISDQKPGDSSMFAGIIVAGFWVAGIWVPISTGDWAYFWWLGLGGWLFFIVWVASAAAPANKYSKLRSDLLEITISTALKVIESRKRDAVEYVSEESVNSRSLTPKGPLPTPQPLGVSHRGAELLIEQWMRFLGEGDAKVTSFTNDGGVDVESLHYIAQVKNYKGSVSVAEVRELQGVSSGDGRKPLFFTSGTYTSDAIKFAKSVSMPLFVYNAEEGNLVAEGELAENLLTYGL